MARQINDAGLQLIASSEGLRLSAYQDVAGIWTIGYGHIRGVGRGMTITDDQAMASAAEAAPPNRRQRERELYLA